MYTPRRYESATLDIPVAMVRWCLALSAIAWLYALWLGVSALIAIVV